MNPKGSIRRDLTRSQLGPPGSVLHFHFVEEERIHQRHEIRIERCRSDRAYSPDRLSHAPSFELRLFVAITRSAGPSDVRFRLRFRRRRLSGEWRAPRANAHTCTAQVPNGGTVPRVAEIAPDGFDPRSAWSANWAVGPRPCSMPPGATYTDAAARPTAATKSHRRRSPALAQPAVDSECPCPGNRESDLVHDSGCNHRSSGAGAAHSAR